MPLSPFFRILCFAFPPFALVEAALTWGEFNDVAKDALKIGAMGAACWLLAALVLVALIVAL